MTSPGQSASGDLHRFTVSRPTEKICMIAVLGEVDMVTAPPLGTMVNREIANNHPVVLLDLSGCDFLGSAGLTVLVDALNRTSGTGTRFALAGLARAVAHSLHAVGLESFFEIYPTTDDAIAGLRAG